MAKQSIIQRQYKREKLIVKYKEKRLQLLQDSYQAKTAESKFALRKRLEKLPRNSIQIRSRNRCWKTGRGRGVYKDFGLCRHMIRQMAHSGVLPGVYKASW
jgi:small subunit ribosomal protein S14